MARLPQPGGDKNAWGHVANEFLGVSHNPDGTIKPAGIQDAVSTQVETTLGVQLLPAVADVVASDPAVAAAAAAAVDAEPRVAQLVTDTDALTVDMATAKSDITIISKRRYDIERFGAIGTSDDGQTWADAYAQVAAWGGGTIAAPPGEYQFLTGFQSRHGVYSEFTGSGNTHLDFSALTNPVNGAAIYGTGALTPLPALGANVALHARTIVFASAPALVPGDVFMIYNTTDFSFSPARAEYRAGEYCRVAAVSGSTITLTSPTYDAYTTGANMQMYRLNGIQTGIAGATMTFNPGYSGIRTAMGTKLRFDDLDMTGSGLNHIWLDRCYDVNLSDVRAFDANPIVGSGINYGVLIGNSQRVRLRDCDLETRRHGMTTGGLNQVGSITNRDIVVSGGRLSGLGNSGAAGVGLHGNTEDTHFNGVQLPNGIVPAGKSGSIKNCTIFSDSTGLAIYFAELLCPDWEIDSNYIKATANHSSNFGLVHVNLTSTSVVGNGTLKITNNIIDLGIYGWTDNNGGHAIRIRKTSPDAVTGNTLYVSRNVFQMSRSARTNDYAIRMDTTETNYGYTSTRMFCHNNVNPHSMRIEQGNSELQGWHFIGAGNGAPSFRARIGSQYFRQDAGGANTLYVATSGNADGWQRVTTTA